MNKEEIRERIAKFLAMRQGEDWSLLPDKKPHHYLVTDKAQWYREADLLIEAVEDLV